MKISTGYIFIQKLLTLLVDLIFPPSDNEKILRDADLLKVRELYLPRNYKTIQYLCNYSNTLIKTAITENKFKNHVFASEIVGIILYEWISSQTKPTIFIPIPLGKKRYRQRGHNQVETILKAIPNQSHIKIYKNILRRVKETKPQSKLKKYQRQENVQDAFMCTDAIQNIPPGTQVVIVDDVVTTGATLLTAKAAVMRKAPNSVTVTCLAIAH